jgi:hypothetical protein
MGVRGDVVLGLGNGITLTPGLRIDAYRSRAVTKVGVDPRVAVRFDLSEALSIEHAFGVVHQAPSFVVPLPGFELADLRGGLQKSLQSSAGVEWRMGKEWTSTLTLFQNAFFELTDLLSLVQYGDELDDIGPTARSLGHTYGLEVVVRRPLTRRFGGYFAYTLSRSERSIGRVHHVASFDRTHVLHAAGAYDLGRRWRAGTRGTFYTGTPTTVAAGDRIAQASGPPPEAGPTAPGVPTPAPTVAEEPPPIHRRLPPFFRVDVRLEKRWLRGTQGAWVAFVLEVLNASAQKEVVSYECDSVRCTKQEIGPVIIPSIGLEGAF